MKKLCLVLLSAIISVAAFAQQETFQYFRWLEIPHPLKLGVYHTSLGEKDSEGIYWRNIFSDKDGKLLLMKGNDSILIPGSPKAQNQRYKPSAFTIDEKDTKWFSLYNTDQFIVRYSKSGEVSYLHPSDVGETGNEQWTNLHAINNRLLIASGNNKFLWIKDSVQVIRMDVPAYSNMALYNDKAETVFALYQTQFSGYQFYTFHADRTYSRRLGSSHVRGYLFNENSKTLTAYASDGVYEVSGKTERKVEVPSYTTLTGSRNTLPYLAISGNQSLEILMSTQGFSVKDANRTTSYLFKDDPALNKDSLRFESYYTYKSVNLQEDSTLVICMKSFTNIQSPQPNLYLFTYKNGVAAYHSTVKVPAGETIDYFNIAYYIGREHTYFYSYRSGRDIIQIRDNSTFTRIPVNAAPCNLYVKSSDMRAGKDFLWISNESYYNDNYHPCRIARMRHEDYYVLGEVFYDTNADGIKNTGEQPYHKISLKAQPSGLLLYPDKQGQFAFKGEAGQQYAIELADTTRFGSVKINGFQIGVKLKNETPEVRTTFWLPRSRCFTNIPASFHLENTGVVPVEKVVIRMSGQNMKLLQNKVFVDTATFTYENLVSTAQVAYDIEWPEAELTGQTATLYTITDLYVSGKLASSKKDSVQTIIRCSYDPNDKQVTPVGLGSDFLTLKNQPLKYQIRFENTGNDTAYQVVIRDTLSPYLDWNTFELQNASHRMITELSAAGILTFHFNNIMLPDSTTDKKNAQGFVVYSIRPKQTVTDRTLVCNRAGIYFDRNKPVITNDACNMLVDKLPEVVTGFSGQDSGKNSVLYPNPAQEWIAFPAGTTEAEIFNQLGQRVSHVRGEKADLTGMEEGFYIARTMIGGKVRSYKFSVRR